MPKRGFSLLEVMIAGAILVIGIVGLLPAFSAGMKHNSRAKAWVEVAELGQELIERIKSGENVPATGSSGRYSWAISQTPAELDGIKDGQLQRCLITISWHEGQYARSERFLYLKK